MTWRPWIGGAGRWRHEYQPRETIVIGEMNNDVMIGDGESKMNKGLSECRRETAREED